MKSSVSDFIMMILLATIILFVLSILNHAYACVSECTYTGDFTRWRDACYSVARCVDKQENGDGECFIESEYFKLETISCDDIIDGTF